MDDPLTLAAAREYLRVIDPEDDTLIEELITAAFREIERRCGLVGSLREFSLAFPMPETELFIPRTPVDIGSIVVEVLADDGSRHAVSDYHIIDRSGWISIGASSAGWPIASPVSAQVTCLIGHVSEFPADALLAAKMMIAARFHDRIAPLPQSALDIIDAYGPRRV